MSVQSLPTRRTSTTEDEQETTDTSSAPPTSTTTSDLDITTSSVGVTDEVDLAEDVKEQDLSDEQVSELESVFLDRGPPDFSAPVTSAQVVAHPAAAAAAMKGSDAVAANVHKTAFQASWSRAKKALIGDPGTEKVMEQLLGLRQRVYDRVFSATMVELEHSKGKEGPLTEGGAAGSTTLSSDIDANLKGTDTEEAVAVFNRIFSADEGWGAESGVVFDVNVYALDFMHGTTEVVDQGKRALAEGARDGASSGGVAGAAADPDVVRADVDEQQSWALVKVRHYSSAAEWQKHLERSGTTLGVYGLAQERHLDYYQSLAGKMVSLAPGDLSALDSTTAGYATKPADDRTPQACLEALAAGLVHGQQDEDIAEEELMLNASNRLYEDRLGEVAKLRKDLEAALSKHKLASGGEDLTALEEAERDVEIKLTLLRDQISEGNLFANEAYLTDGAVNHAVQGLQIGKTIRQTKGESGNAVTENLGDALKEIRRHGDSLGEAAFKSGKYIFRLGDAAKNAGVKTAGVQAAYAAGNEISNTIKNTDYSASDVERPGGGGNPWHDASSDAVHKHFGASTNDADALADMVQQIGGEAMAAIQQMDQLELGAAVTKPS